MGLYGIYGSHTLADCPLFNESSRELLLSGAAGLDATGKRLGVKVVSSYHAALEHTFVWVVESDGAHVVETFLIESRMAEWNTARVVPLNTLQNVVQTCQKLEDEKDR